MAAFKSGGDSGFQSWELLPANPSYYTSSPTGYISALQNSFVTVHFPGDSSDGSNWTYGRLESYVFNTSENYIFSPTEYNTLLYKNSWGGYDAYVQKGASSTSVGDVLNPITGIGISPSFILPSIPGDTLILSEHTHPVPTVGGLGVGESGPSNADVYTAAKNPGVIFVVNQATYHAVFSSTFQSKFYYYGFGG
jgi:hypothetical protein